MKTHALLALSLIWGAPALDAQTCVYFPDAKTKGTTSLVPFGAKNRNDKNAANQYLQFIVPGSKFGNQPVDIRSVGFVPATSRVHYFGQVSVNLQHTTRTKVGTNLLSNGSGRHVSALHRAVEWKMWHPQWNRIPIDYRFDPRGRNLLVSIKVLKGESMSAGDAGFVSDPTVDSVYVRGFDFNAGFKGTLTKGAPKIEFCVDRAFVTTFLDSGCKGSHGNAPRLSIAGVPQLGKRFTVDLDSARPVATFAVLVWSFRSLGWQLPGGCTLRPSPDFINGVATTARGTSSFPLTVPNDVKLVGGVPLLFQYFAYDPKASSLGFAGSNWALARVGR